jgi:hypothetical protein
LTEKDGSELVFLFHSADLGEPWKPTLETASTVLVGWVKRRGFGGLCRS